MKQPTYNFVKRLIGRVTLSSQSDNDSFIYYGHFIELQSGTADYVSVTIHKTVDRYEGEITCFSFDYLTKELHFVFSECKALTEKIINAFTTFYAPRRIRISYDKMEYEDEDATYEYDEADEDKPPVKHLNK